MKEKIITDTELAKSLAEADIMCKIIEILKGVKPERRLVVLRCASIMTLGKDLDELGDTP